MVNQDFDKFKKEQQTHQSAYLGGADQKQKRSIGDSDYNNQSDTDKSPGATGRNIKM